MEYLDVVRAAFDDELSNILSHTKEAGFLRSGRRPFSAETLIRKTSAMDKLSTDAASGMKGNKYLKPAALGVASIAAWEKLKQEKRRRDIGKEVLKQQAGA